MVRSLMLVPCLLLMLASCGSYAQTPFTGVITELESLSESVPGHAAAECELKILDLETIELHAFERESRPLLAYIRPPKGTLLEVVGKVYGSQSRLQKGGKGPDYWVYSLGESGLELRVFVQGKKVEFTEVVAKSGEGVFSIGNRSEAISARDRLSYYREVVPRYRAVIVEYEKKLIEAPWNWR